MKPGKLIVFEGTDGAGKSTQVQLLAEYLTANGIDTVATYEPTNGPIGQRIRSLYTNRGQVTKAEELDLFLADRKEHVENLINPSLKLGKIVLCDRYYLSTAAYQGALGFNVEDIIKRNNFAPEPDLVLLFDLPVQLGRERIHKNRGEATNDFEKEEMLTKVANIFNQLDFPYIRRIDASMTIDEIHDNILQHVTFLLEQ